MPTWILAKKEFRVLLRDPWSAILLLVMPLLFIFVLGLLLGEGFGQKSDDRTRVVIVNLDEGVGENETTLPDKKGGKWSDQVFYDLEKTAGLRVETLTNEAEARRLVREHKLASVLILKRNFSRNVNTCGFLSKDLNPFERDGIKFETIDVELVKDDKQPGQSAIIEQVSQVTLLRVILPFMIGKAFLQLGEPAFIQLLGEQVYLPVPPSFSPAFALLDVPRKERYRVSTPAIETLRNDHVPTEVLDALKAWKDRPFATKEAFAAELDRALPEAHDYRNKILASCREETVNLNEMLRVAARSKTPGLTESRTLDYQERVGTGVQGAVNRQFDKYQLTGMTWEKLIKSNDEGDIGGGGISQHVNAGGSGVLNRGAHRYQLLVPAYTVMFSFFLVLMVGWIFVTERRQGTLKRLQLAPISRGEVLLGKLIPCLAISLAQGALLLVAGKLLFGMNWGPQSWPVFEQALWLIPVVVSTSVAAMGLAMLVASLARTEMQVALLGAIPVLVLALIGGCVLPREMMPEQTQNFTLLSPHGWALQAYAELLDPSPQSNPNIGIVLRACGVLAAFGLVTVGIACAALRLE
jgi:ABC-type multidrug transport system permease subunit